MTSNPTRIWFNTAQAAAHVEQHVSTIRKALEAGTLHGGQRATGGHWRIHRDCLDAWALGEPCPHGKGGRAGA
jgi:excisionase family DNA binding protein